MSEEIEKSLDAFIEYAMATNKIADACRYREFKAYIQSLQSQVDEQRQLVKKAFWGGFEGGKICVHSNIQKAWEEWSESAQQEKPSND